MNSVPNLYLNNLVAIKKFKESDEDEIAKKTIMREVKMLRMLKHPNIVLLKEAFKRKGRLYLVFEYLEYDLKKFMRKRGNDPLNSDEAQSFLYQILQALIYLH